MKPKICIGKIVEQKFDDKLYLCLAMPRKPEEANMSFSIESIFKQFVGKTVKITIEEIE